MFRKRKPAKHLSAEELKSKLYDHFDKTGSLNQMRTEIRGKLVTELFKISTPTPSDVGQRTTDFDKTLLPLQVCNWLVYDHLLRQGYQYALSTFVTEANVPHPERLLTASDILGLFRLDSATPEYKSISKMYSASNEQGLLHSLLLAVIKSLFDFPTEETVNQSTTARDTGVSIKEPPDNNALFANVDSSEIPRFNQESYTRPRKKSTDSNFQEQLQLLKGEKEKEIQALRQKWLQELDRLHSQERAMREETDTKRREVQRELDEILAEKERLKEKEFLLIKEHENKLEKRMRELETDYMSQMHSKESELKVSQGKLYDKELRVAQVEADFASLQTNYQSLKRELEEIQQTYKIIKEKYSTLLDENTKLLRKFESMSDYAILKGDLEIRSKETSSLRQDLDENKRTAEKEKEASLEKIRSLETKLKHKESQLTEVQGQLNLCRDTMHREEAIWHKERRKLEHDSQESKEIYKTLIRRLEEQRDDIQALHHTIHILHYQLTDTDKKSQTKPDTFVPQRTAAKYLDNKKEPGIFRFSNNSKDSSKYADDSLKFIEEAKGRIKNLEREANTLRDKCSTVYCHVPDLQNIHGPKSTTIPLVYNSINVPNVPFKNFQSQPYNNCFETLIRNEMPTLDSCLQTHPKSLTDLHFLKTTDSKPYSSDYLKSFESDRSKTTAFSNLSSLNLQQQDFAPKCAGDGLNVNNPSRSKENSESPSLEQPTETNNHTTKTMPLNSESKEILINTPNKPGSSLKENLFPETGEENKTGSELPNLESPPVRSLESYGQIRPLTLNSISSATNTTQTSPKYSSNEQDENESGKAPDEALRKMESLLKDDSALKPDPTIVVDLDSAWRRKTSLKDDSPKKTDPSILVDLDSAWKRKTSLKDDSESQSGSAWKRRMSSSLNSNPSTQFKDVMGKSVEKVLEVERKQISNEHNKQCEDSPSHISNDDQNAGLNSMQNKQAHDLTRESKPQDENNKNETKPSSEDTEKKTDPLVEKQTLQEDKPILEDSQSELSDIHLSCGSEQEQQKEDSDNW